MLTFLPGAAPCHSRLQTGECGGDSTNKSLKTEVRLFHNFQRLETVQGREAGLLERLSSQQRKFPSSRDTG